MICLFCKQGPAQGVTVFRVNAKGQPGVWACERHMKQTDTVIPADVKAVTDCFKAKP